MKEFAVNSHQPLGGIQLCYKLSKRGHTKVYKWLNSTKRFFHTSANLLNKKMGKYNVLATYRAYAIVYKLNYNIHVIVEREDFLYKFFRSYQIKGKENKNENNKK